MKELYYVEFTMRHPDDTISQHVIQLDKIVDVEVIRQNKVIVIETLTGSSYIAMESDYPIGEFVLEDYANWLIGLSEKRGCCGFNFDQHVDHHEFEFKKRCRNDE